jgi:hypothetical protein
VQVQTITEGSYAVCPVYLTDEDLTNVGLMGALYKGDTRDPGHRPARRGYRPV